MTPLECKTITRIQADARVRLVVEQAYAPCIMRWLMYSLAEDKRISEQDRGHACYLWGNLDFMLREIAAGTGHMNRAQRALDATAGAIDIHFAQFAFKGKDRKRLPWLAVASFHVAGYLADEGLTPPLVDGSLLCDTMNECVAWVTETQVENFNKTASREAKKAVDYLRQIGAGKAGLWRTRWEDRDRDSPIVKAVERISTPTRRENAA